MIDCMTLEQMIAFTALLGDIVTVFGDYDAVRIDAETATTWWYPAPQTSHTGVADPQAQPILCRAADPGQG